MAKDAAYRKAEQEIEEVLRSGAMVCNLKGMGLTELPDSLWELTQLQELKLSRNQLTVLPEAVGQLTALQALDISENQLTALPETIGQLTALQSLDIARNQLTALPEGINQLSQLIRLQIGSNKLQELPLAIRELKLLKELILFSNKLDQLPTWIGELTCLQLLILTDNSISSLPDSFSQLTMLTTLHFGHDGYHGNPLKQLPSSINQLSQITHLDLVECDLNDLPPSIAQFEHLEELKLDKNPLNPELAAAYEQGLDAVKAYLRAKTEGGEIVLNEAKLILVGEGGVGKTSLLAALRGEEFVEDRPTTHGVEVNIKSMVVSDPDNGAEITLNGWDFGGQNIYRHTHQLFFTAPAVYLAVWEPRRGSEQCRVGEWIKMIKHRAYDESRPEERPRILIVATHGGPKERLAHIDEQALRDEFGDLIVGFHHVDSRPDENGICYQLDDLKAAIGREAAAIPSVGRTVPRNWKDVLDALRKRSEKDPYISYEQFENLCNRHKVSNELAVTYAAILNELGHLIYYGNDESLRNTVILNPEYLSKAVGFVLEDKPTKENYGLIEHARLNDIWNDPGKSDRDRYPEKLYPVFIRLMEKFDLSYQIAMPQPNAPKTSLMAQLVPGQRPAGWQDDWTLKPGDVERTQVCRVLDAVTGRTTEAEGLMYRLIVRLHRYSLGRKNYLDSRHWKTGMVLDDGYNGRGFIEEIGGDVYVTVRAAYPERFLHLLCSEIQWLVENFWKGLDARLFVPCPTDKCKGLLEMDEMLENKANEIPKIRCSVCRTYHQIDDLMSTMQAKPAWSDALTQLREGQERILQAQEAGFGEIGTQLRVLMSQADEQYANLLAWLSDPAKEGPRLFSFEPVQRSRFNPRTWATAKFNLILWCEHSRIPVHLLNGHNSREGIIELELTREWFRQAAPVLKILTGTLSLILPVASSGLKVALDKTVYDAMSDQLDFGKDIIDASLSGAEKAMDWFDGSDETELKRSELMRAQGGVLHELHSLLKAKDPNFGGLVRVQNKKREFLWVHRDYVSDY